MLEMVTESVELSMYSRGEGASHMVPKMLRMILLAKGRGRGPFFEVGGRNRWMGTFISAAVF